MTILPLQPHGIPEVEAIDTQCFPNPGERVDFEAELQREQSRVVVARSAGKIVAYLLYWHVADEFEVMNVAVDPSAQRRGFARALLDALMREARLQAVSRIHLEVRASNVAARALYDTAGFDEVGGRADYYPEPLEDAVLLSRTLP